MNLSRRTNGKHRNYPSSFDDFFLKDFFDWPNSSAFSMPGANILEKNDSFQIELAAPGLNKEDFEVELKDDELYISANVKRDLKKTEDGEGVHYTLREFRYERFQRRFSLPNELVDTNKIQAKYENGILYILIPKMEEAKALPPRKIKIS